jgi:hypothetical protein
MDLMLSIQIERISSVCFHNFGVTTEWHVYATSHGEGTYDSVAGTVKRLAAYASLQ